MKVSKNLQVKIRMKVLKLIIILIFNARSILKLYCIMYILFMRFWLLWDVSNNFRNILFVIFFGLDRLMREINFEYLRIFRLYAILNRFFFCTKWRRHVQN